MGHGRILQRRRARFATALVLALVASALPLARGQSDDAGANEPAAVAGTDWAQFYNGPAGCCESRPLLAVDNAGAAIVAGQSTTYRESPAGAYNDDITTIKYSATGAELWARRFDGDGHSTDTPVDVETDAAGNVYVAGYAGRAAHIDTDYVILKYDAGGVLLWAKYAGESGEQLWDHAAALDVDAEGNVYVTGRSTYKFLYGSQPVFRFSTVKLDAQGNQLWRSTFETADALGAEAADVEAAADGSVYVTGRARVRQPSGYGGDDVFTVKYDAGGQEVWVRRFDNPGTPDEYDRDAAVRIHLDGGHVYVLGYGLVNYHAQDNDIYVLKYTPAGALVRTSFSGNTQNEVASDWAFDGAGAVYVAGTILHPTNPPYFNQNSLALKFDAGGARAWRREYEGPGRGDDFGRGLVLDGAGAVYLGVDSQEGDGTDNDFVLIRYNAADGSGEQVSRYDNLPPDDNDRLFGVRLHAGHIYLTGESLREPGTGRVVDYLTLRVSVAADDGGGPPPGSGAETVWFDDSLPGGAVGYANGETWNWVTASPAPYSGASAHQSAAAAGVHNHYFQSASQSLPVSTGDKLFTYVYLDPANLPSELMLQWFDGTEWKNAYWGADQINWIERVRIGDLPAAGQWVRLEVSAASLGLEGKTLTGMSFVLSGGRATFDKTGKVASSTPPPTGGQMWFDDALPGGAVAYANGETWQWVTASPSPYSGTKAHQSAVAPGIHNHYFTSATETLSVSTGDLLYTYLFIDPANLPSEIMLQWHDGTNWRNAYWGTDHINWVERVRVGDIPTAGQWVRLEVPASALGLENKTLSGMSFVLVGGRAAFDKAGKSPPTP